MASTRRLSRYKILRNNGFTNFEAAVLSNVPLDVPYMKDLVADRKQRKADAIEKGLTEDQYNVKVRQDYIDNKFYKEAGVGRRARIDVWKMFRDWKKRFEAQYPNYESPWKKRRRNWVEAMEKFDRTLAKQHGFID